MGIREKRQGKTAGSFGEWQLTRVTPQPIRQKTGKPSPKPKKPLPKRSAKKLAYLASPARKEGLEHMGMVSALPCLICGSRPVEVHHMPDPRSDFRTIALCPPHHRREFGPGAFHYSPKAFMAIHGDAEELLRKTAEAIARQSR
jgi:hypothetical protein